MPRRLAALIKSTHPPGNPAGLVAPSLSATLESCPKTGPEHLCFWLTVSGVPGRGDPGLWRETWLRKVGAGRAGLGSDSNLPFFVWVLI